MAKTNVIYTASITDNGSILNSENPFTVDNVANLKSNDTDNCLFVWGNAYSNVGYAYKTDGTPTSGAFLSFDINSKYVNSQVHHLNRTEVQAGVSAGFDLGSQKYVDRLRIILLGANQYINSSVTPTNETLFKVYYSNDNLSWTLISTYTSNNISITGGEIILSFTRTSARYFKLYMAQNVAASNTNFPCFYHKIYLIDTQAGYQFKSKIDLGHKYNGLTLYLQTRLKRDHLNWSIKSSTDDSVYNTNTLSFGNTWTSLSSPPTFGRLLFDNTTGNLFCVSTTGIYLYNFELDSWSIYDNSSSLLQYLGLASDIDENRGIIYSYSASSNKAVSYFLKSKTFKILPDLPNVPVTSYSYIVSGCFAFNTFFLSINLDSINNDYPDTSSNFNRTFLSYSHLDDKWRLTEFRFLSLSAKGLPIQPLRAKLYSEECMVICGFTSGRYNSGSQLIYPNSISPFDVIPYYGGGSWNSYNGMQLEYFVSQKKGQNLGTGVGRPQTIYDTDKRFLFPIVLQNGNLGSYGNFTRRTDWFIDIANNDIFVFPDNNYNNNGQIYHIGGLNPAGNNSTCYVSDSKRIYRMGAFELSGASSDFKYYDTEEFVAIKASLSPDTRFITIDNTTTGHWPMMINQIEIIENNNETGFGMEPSGFYSRKNIEFNLTQPSEVYEIPVFNNKDVVTSSGIAFIEPNGTEGSRCFQISDSDAGPWHSHCIYNDLDNSICTANSELYGTSECGIMCTSITAGVGATGYYIPDTVEISATASGVDYLYVIGNMPTFATSEDKVFDIIAEFYE